MSVWVVITIDIAAAFLLVIFSLVHARNKRRP